MVIFEKVDQGLRAIISEEDPLFVIFFFEGILVSAAVSPQTVAANPTDGSISPTRILRARRAAWKSGHV